MAFSECTLGGSTLSNRAELVEIAQRRAVASSECDSRSTQLHKMEPCLHQQGTKSRMKHLGSTASVYYCPGHITALARSHHNRGFTSGRAEGLGCHAPDQHTLSSLQLILQVFRLYGSLGFLHFPRHFETRTEWSINATPSTRATPL